MRDMLVPLLLSGLVLLGCERTPSPSSDDEATSAAPTTVPSSAEPALAEPVPQAASRTIAEGLIPLAQLVQLGRFPEARTAIEEYRRGTPEDADGALLEGLLYHQAKRYLEAVPRFEEALSLDPNYHLVQHFLGWARFYLGDMAEARIAFLAHIASDPTESDSIFGLGLVELEEGNLNAAESRFEQAIAVITALAETDPTKYERRRRDFGKVYGRLGDIAFARRDYAAAKVHLERALAESPNLYTVVFTLSQVERRLGNDLRADELEALHTQMREAREGRVRRPAP